MAELAIIIPAYRGDFELAVGLCRSIDRHLKGSYEHLLIVPKRDVARFETLAGPNRRVLARLIHGDAGEGLAGSVTGCSGIGFGF